MNKTYIEHWGEDMASPFWIFGFVLLIIVGLIKCLLHKREK